MYLISYEIHAISYEIISQMKWFFLPRCLCTAGQGGGWAGNNKQHRRGFDLHLVFATSYVLYCFAHILYENTHLFLGTFHMKFYFILKLSHLYFHSFALTQQYLDLAGRVLIFLVLFQKAFCSVILGDDLQWHSLLVSVVLVEILCWFWSWDSTLAAIHNLGIF